jgi:WD40 repeat protein
MMDHTDYVGQQFGEYRLQRWLGGGGYGNVYLGKHVRDSSLAAVKILRARLVESQELKEFINEARTIRLVHPHIVRLLDFGIGANDIPYLVMEYAPNGTLRHRHPRYKRVPLTTVKGYVSDIASALQYAHDQHLIHRDVKPENMLIGPQQEIWLSDFGLVAIAQSTHSFDEQRGASGTLPYMAPEQIQGRPRPASDQYALGIVIYEWLSGQRPFGGTTAELITQHTAAPPPLLRARVPNLPGEVEQVIFTALQKDPTLRFGSIQAFANAFEQACHLPDTSTGINTQPMTQSGGPLPITTEKMTPINTPFSTSPILSSQPQISSPSTSSSRDQISDPLSSQAQISDPLSERAQVSSTASEQPQLSSTAPEQPQVSSPSSEHAQINDIPPFTKAEEPEHGRQLLSRRTVIAGVAAAAVVGGVGGYLLWRRTLPQPGGASGTQPAAGTQAAVVLNRNRIGRLQHSYRGHSDNVYDVKWARTDGRIVSASADKTAQIWNVFKDTSKVIYKGHTERVNAVDWGGKYIVSGSSDQTAQVWNATDGSTLLVYKQHTGAIFTVGWSPGKGRIASGGQDKTIRVWNYAIGNNTYIYVGHNDVVNKLAWSPVDQRIASCSNDRTVHIWEDRNANGGNALIYSGHSDSVLTVAWSPDGKLIASGGNDQTVQVWDPTSGKTIYVYREHSAAVTSVAWSPDGKSIVSGSEDHTVHIWEAMKGDTIYTYPGHTGAVLSVAWSHNGKFIASSGDHTDPAVQIWNA